MAQPALAPHRRHQLWRDIARALRYGATPGHCDYCGSTLPARVRARGFTCCQSCLNLPEMDVCTRCGQYTDVIELTLTEAQCSPCRDAEIARIDAATGDAWREVWE